MDVPIVERVNGVQVSPLHASRFAASYNLNLGGSGNKELARRRERYKMDGLSQNAMAWAHNPVPLENKTRAMLDS